MFDPRVALGPASNSVHERAVVQIPRAESIAAFVFWSCSSIRSRALPFSAIFGAAYARPQANSMTRS